MKKGLTPQNKKRAEYALFLEQQVCCYLQLYTKTVAESSEPGRWSVMPTMAGAAPTGLTPGGIIE